MDALTKPIYVDDRPFNRTSREYEQSPFVTMMPDGTMYYSGANVRVYFDDILVDEIESVGVQLAQNIKPINPYHSYVATRFQTGARIAQGYFQMTLTKSAKLPSILTAVELRRRQRRRPFLQNTGTAPQQVVTSSAITLGSSLEEAIAALSHKNFDWKQVADEYDARRFGYAVQSEEEQIRALMIDGLMPAVPMVNSFRYGPRGTHLCEEGFTLSLVYGPVEDTFDQRIVYSNGRYVIQDSPEETQGFRGTLRQMVGVRVVAGPNAQHETDGKPASEMYTIIGQDLF